MSHVKRFLHFWYDFIIGDDWAIAAGAVIGLVGTGALAASGFKAWWLMPLVVTIVFAISLWRETRTVK